MLQLKVLVLELVAVDGLAAGAVVVGEVAALAHKVGDDAVERGPLVAEPLLAGAEGAEVLGRLGHDVGPQLHDDAAQGLAVGGHVEENLPRTKSQ